MMRRVMIQRLRRAHSRMSRIVSSMSREIRSMRLRTSSQLWPPMSPFRTFGSRFARWLPEGIMKPKVSSFILSRILHCWANIIWKKSIPHPARTRSTLLTRWTMRRSPSSSEKRTEAMLVYQREDSGLYINFMNNVNLTKEPHWKEKQSNMK